MIASSLFSPVITPVRPTDTGEEVLARMHDFRVRHLPVVQKNSLVGMVSENDILAHNGADTIKSYHLRTALPRIGPSEHLFEVMQVMAEYQLTVAPISDEKGRYQGCVSLEDLLQWFAHSASVREPGSIILLEMQRHNYSMSEISRIVESENALIMSAFLTSEPLAETLEVTLKINRLDVQPIVATFLRFGYEVKATFQEEEYVDSLKERYDALMAYLNV